MFYSRQESGSSLLRFLAMFVVALGLAVYFLITDVAYDRAGVMLAAAVLSGGYCLWQLRTFESLQAVKDEIARRMGR